MRLEERAAVSGKKKKLLMTASSFEHIERFHLPYLREFQRLGWETHVAYGGDAGTAAWIDKLIPLPLEKRIASVSNFRACRVLRGLMKEEGYDLVIAHTSLGSFFTRMAAAGLRQRPKMISVMHGYLFGGSMPKRQGLALRGAELLAAPWTDLLLTMNSRDEEWARAHHAGKRIERIPGMGVDVQRLEQAGEAETVFPEGSFVLICPAEFSERKSQEVLIRAMAKLPERVKLLLPGEGLQQERCKTLAEKLGLAERISFPGFVKDIGSLLKQADVMVSASRSEGLPFSVMEGMLMGLPVVASHVKGHTDLVTEGENGYLYEYGDESALAGAIMRLMEDGALRARLGEAGRKRVAAYTLDKVLPQVMGMYLSVVGSAG